MKFLVKMEQINVGYHTVEAENEVEAMKQADREYLMLPERFTLSKGKIYAKDVDRLD